MPSSVVQESLALRLLATEQVPLHRVIFIGLGKDMERPGLVIVVQYIMLTNILIMLLDHIDLCRQAKLHGCQQPSI